MRRRPINCLLWLLCILPITAKCQIISPERLFGRYQQFVWQDQHGLPQNGISAIAQTPDGYLWLAIAEGVARFDGVRFTAFDTGNTPEIKSNNVQSLLVDRSGALWIGTHGGGLTRYQDGHFSHYSTEQGLSDTHARSLFEDRTGNLWVGTDGGGLNLFRNNGFTVFSTANGLPDNHISAIGEDGAGNLWIGTTNGLARFKDNQFTVFTTKDGLAGNNISKIFCDRAGDLWISSSGGLNRFHDGRFDAFGAREGLKSNEIKSMAQDRDGTLWFGTNEDGLYRFKDGRFAASTTREGLISDNIQAIYADREGDIWLGTSGGGLAHLRAGRFSVYTSSDGLPDNMVGAIYEDKSGGIWVGTGGGLCRFKDGKFTVITAPNGNALRGVSGISQDREGNLWINSSNSQTGDKVLKYSEGNSTVEIIRDKAFDNRAAVTLQDRTGNFWFGTSQDGLHLIQPDGRETVFHKKDGLADEYVNVLYEDLEGSIWVGTRSGLSRFKNGGFTSWTAQNGFGDNHILSFHEDFRGNLWIGTHGDGLFRFRDERFTRFTAKDGLYDNLAFSILEDDAGNLWMSGNKGIYRASLAELEDFAMGRRPFVNSFAYGSADGMLSRECNGANPAGIRARDGRLWFPTIKGVVVVDPKRLDAAPPNVSLEQVLIDNQISPADQTIEMQPEQENLEIQFTALSWNRPQQIKFKYKMVGLDADWVEAGTRRTAYYPHVPPGEYTFRVIADNGEGVWNTEGQSLSIVVLPPFYRTWWFISLAALVAAGLVVLVFRWRILNLKRKHREQEMFSRKLIESQEQERKRIAAELHDSLGQSLVVIKNRARIGLRQNNDAEQMGNQLDGISIAATQAIKEIREISYNLRPYLLDKLGLTKTLRSMLSKVFSSSDISLTTDIDEIDAVFAADSEILFYRIVQESANNIIKHSQATAAKVTIKRAKDILLVKVEDNGQGFDQNADGNSAKRSFGLIGIAERARLLGGKHSIKSAVGQGTIVTIELELYEPHTERAGASRPS